MTAQPTHDHLVTDRSLLSTKAYGTGRHLAARQSLYRWQTPRHDLPGIVVNELADVRGVVADVGCGNGKFVTRVREDRPDLNVVPMDVSHGIAIVSTNSRRDKRELEHLWRQSAGDVLGVREGPARVQLSARFTLEDAPAILGTAFGEIRTIPLPGVIEVTDAEPVVAHLASYEAWADRMGVPFLETIERARERVDETIQAEGAFRVTCLGGMLVCR
ncbi:SAM-dependent methyltransferase [Streptomyces albidoflavus]